MDDISSKAKRIKPLIKIKRTQLEREASVLGLIRNEKQAALEHLQKTQHSYMRGIEDLNKERQSPGHNRLAVLERSVDSAKSLWYQSLKKLRTIEGQENAQLALLLKAERDLRSVEKLDERYLNEISKLEKKKDQNQLDEAALRGFKGR